MEIYNKLVRDKIDEKIRANGEIPETRILDIQEYKRALLDKLDEEILELKEAINLGDNDKIKEESADVLAVIKAINKVNANEFNEVIKEMQEKEVKRGGFEKRLYLISVTK